MKPETLKKNEPQSNPLNGKTKLFEKPKPKSLILTNIRKGLRNKDSRNFFFKFTGRFEHFNRLFYTEIFPKFCRVLVRRIKERKGINDYTEYISIKMYSLEVRNAVFLYQIQSFF